MKNWKENNKKQINGREGRTHIKTIVIVPIFISYSSLKLSKYTIFQMQISAGKEREKIKNSL